MPGVVTGQLHVLDKPLEVFAIHGLFCKFAPEAGVTSPFGDALDDLPEAGRLSEGMQPSTTLRT